MPVDQRIAAPTLPSARIEGVSPWRSVRRGWRTPTWLTALAALWREGMELYARAAPYRGFPWGFW